MGGVELHQLLKNLCFNTDWKYAVYWKFKHQAKMMLTWEDSYCNNDAKKSNRFDNMNDNLKDEKYTQDLLGLAIAKMSYQVYSIGEGIVGEVAATGKHQWIYGHRHVNSLGSLDEHFDGWKTQFIAGIKTVVVVNVVPYGVVQLGSLNTIGEDLKLVKYIREIFFELQSSLMESTDCSPCVTDLSTSLGSTRFHKYENNQDTMTETNGSNTWTTLKTTNDHQENENPTSNPVQSSSCQDQNQDLFIPTFSNNQILNNSKTETIESFKFPAGYELYEALGPAFYKHKNNFDWETVTTETLTIEETSNKGHLTQTLDSENLLEAVVRSTSFGQPDKPISRDLLTSGSACYSSAKVGKKRARNGESCKPRPRDRQLIQDRIKELRQLVPNGSKCSIDSLLERTIKHMLFMQSITKHADKIDKCAEFMLLGKETGVQRPFNHEHGSSWAMEVGNDLKVCPIIVENIGVDGQMLVEMICDECVDFMEITETIRSLGLTILKGVTDVYGDKTWMCFVVEGVNNRNIHRLDILWSLVQILELKTKT